MNNRKRIAVLVGQAEDAYQEQFICGFLSQVFKFNYDVCVFAMYEKYQESTAREIGESSIFSLIEYEQFDAIVLMEDTIQALGFVKKIESKIKKYFDGAVLCVDAENDYFPYIHRNCYELSPNAMSGYDSDEEGKDSPKPITSMILSARTYGEYAGVCIKSLLEGKELPEFKYESELFIGSSCGCHNDSMIPKVLVKERWCTDMFEKGFFSPNNHMNEDLLCQTTFYGLINVLDSYVYLIRDFDEFHICLNEDWDDPEKKVLEGHEDEIFSRRMLHVLKCGPIDSSQDVISFDTYFKTSLLLPELHEQHSEPAAYFFTPLHFEEKIFGYAVICYRNQAKSYNAIYRMWLRNVMQELECFRRIEAIQRSNQFMQTRYSLGLDGGIESGQPKSNQDSERLGTIAGSKKNGNKVNEWKISQSEKLTEEEYKEAQMVRKLLDENCFNYHFQPIVNAKNGEIFGYEALMRLDVEPYMPPTVVLKYADYFDRLYDVERATFFNVLNIVKQNKEIFDGNRKVFINSIPGNLMYGEDALRLEVFAQELTNTVVVELTEQQELTDSELLKLKDYFSKVGFQTAIDDYGTGYSNVTNLLRYMPNCVKVDRMLLTNIQDSPQKQHFVKDIIMFCHDNDILVLAEGVETQEELQMVIHLGVDLLQGFYTAKPAKEIVTAISRTIRNEILEYNRIESTNRGRRVYVAGKEGRISLARLTAEKYSVIEITNEETVHRNVRISGAADLETDIYIRVKNGYQGRIILENVTLQGKKHNASIDIGNECDVILELHGENRCLNGGIRVPAGSRLMIEGEGQLHITVDAANYFGIGNDIDAKHGELVFEQNGLIDINGRGMKGVGIGSGLGGMIRIQRGKYILNLIGQDGVGIGAFTGDVMPVVKQCDIRIKIATAKAVGIGSLMGDVHLRLEHLAWIGEISADDVVGLGTLEGKKSHIEMWNVNIMADIRAYKLCGIGAGKGETFISLDNGAVLITGSGTDAIAFGTPDKLAQINIGSAKLESQLNTSLHTDLGAEIQNVHIDNGECRYMADGEQVVWHS